MSGLIIVPNYMPALDTNGRPIPGALMWFYLNETTTLTTVYSSAALNTPLSNPVVSDSSGVFPLIYAPAGTPLTVTVTTADGAPIVTYDNIYPGVSLSDIGRVYIEDLRGFETGYSTQETLNADIIQAWFDSNVGLLWGSAGTIYSIGHRISIPADCGLMYDGPTNNKPTIYLPAANFGNIDQFNPSSHANGCGLYIAGVLSDGGAAIDNVIIQGFHIQCEVQDGRALNPIAIRNATNISLINTEVSGFPLGFAIAMDSVRGFLLENVYVHDGYISTGSWVAGETCNITGIAIDQSRLNDGGGDPIGSGNGAIKSPVIDSVRVGGDFLTSFGYQTDGITLGHGCYDITITDPTITETGEPLDIQGLRIVVTGVKFRTCRAYGAKFIHGAQECSITGGSITDVGVAHCVMAGSASALTGDTKGNVVSGIAMSGFITDAYTSTQVQACVVWSGSAGSGAVCINNLVTACTFDASGGGQWIVRDDLSCYNNAVEGIALAGGSDGWTTFSDKSNTFRPSLPSRVIAGASVQVSVPAGGNKDILYDMVELDRLGEWDTVTGVFTPRYTGERPFSVNNRLQAVVSGQTYSINLLINAVGKRQVSRVASVSLNFDLSLSSSWYFVEGVPVKFNIINGSGTGSDTTANSENANLSIGY